MKRRWDSTRVVLTSLIVLLALVGYDLTRKFFSDSSEARFRATQGENTPRFREGDLAPDFTLPDSKGADHSLASLVKGDTLLCFLCGCGHCRHTQTYLTRVLKQMGARAPRVVSVTTAPAQMEAAWRRDTGLEQTLLYESKANGSPITTMYRGHPCPRIFRLRADRHVAWIGPSPAEVNDMKDVGMAMAQNLVGDQAPPDRPGRP